FQIAAIESSRSAADTIVTGCSGGVEFSAPVGGKIERELAHGFLGVLRGVELRGDHRRDLVELCGEKLGGLRERFVVGAGGSDGARAAEELDAGGLPDLLRLPQEYGADFAGGADVRAAARAAIEAVDRDDAQRAGSLGRLA